MQEEIIKNGDQILAKIYRNDIYPPNLTFYTKDSDFVQVASWNYDTGKHLKAHSHKIYDRTTNRANEVIYIKTGRLKAYFYNEEDKLVAELEMKEGDMAIVIAGGHAYDILENQTQVLEVKNGPYPGIEIDKKIIEL